MNRIEESFGRLRQEQRGGLIPFITAGDPDLNTTRQLLIELAQLSATVIELGVPFSDPMADGPVIQRASERALKHNFGLAEVLQVVADARRRTDVPIVLFSYYNPLLQFGVERLSREARRAGVDGVLVTDLVPEEAADFHSALTQENLEMIFLVAPTSTDQRLYAVAERAGGFIYAVSRTGVTGAQAQLDKEAQRLVARVRRVTDLPVAVGFGISSAKQVAEVWRYADAAVVGSAIVAEIERHASEPDLITRVSDFTRMLLPEEQQRLAV